MAIDLQRPEISSFGSGLGYGDLLDERADEAARLWRELAPLVVEIVDRRTGCAGGSCASGRGTGRRGAAPAGCRARWRARTGPSPTPRTGRCSRPCGRRGTTASGRRPRDDPLPARRPAQGGADRGGDRPAHDRRLPRVHSEASERDRRLPARAGARRRTGRRAEPRERCRGPAGPGRRARSPALRRLPAARLRPRPGSGYGALSLRDRPQHRLSRGAYGRGGGAVRGKRPAVGGGAGGGWAATPAR